MAHTLSPPAKVGLHHRSLADLLDYYRANQRAKEELDQRVEKIKEEKKNKQRHKQNLQEHRRRKIIAQANQNQNDNYYDQNNYHNNKTLFHPNQSEPSNPFIRARIAAPSLPQKFLKSKKGKKNNHIVETKENNTDKKDSNHYSTNNQNNSDPSDLHFIPSSHSAELHSLSLEEIEEETSTAGNEGKQHLIPSHINHHMTASSLAPGGRYYLSSFWLRILYLIPITLTLTNRLVEIEKQQFRMNARSFISQRLSTALYSTCSLYAYSARDASLILLNRALSRLVLRWRWRRRRAAVIRLLEFFCLIKTSMSIKRSLRDTSVRSQIVTLQRWWRDRSEYLIEQQKVLYDKWVKREEQIAEATFKQYNMTNNAQSTNNNSNKNSTGSMGVVHLIMTPSERDAAVSEFFQLRRSRYRAALHHHHMQLDAYYAEHQHHLSITNKYRKQRFLKYTLYNPSDGDSTNLDQSRLIDAMDRRPDYGTLDRLARSMNLPLPPRRPIYPLMPSNTELEQEVQIATNQCLLNRTKHKQSGTYQTENSISLPVDEPVPGGGKRGGGAGGSGGAVVRVRGAGPDKLIPLNH